MDPKHSTFNGEVHIPFEDVPVTSSSSTHSPPPLASKAVGLLLRLGAALLSVAALVIMVKDKQVIYVQLGQVRIPIQAKHTDVKAFVYLVYANGAVAIYSFLVGVALFFSFIAKADTGRLSAWILFIIDQALTYVLLGAAAASTEVSYLAEKGNEKVQWGKVCNTLGHFCNLVGASLIATFICVVVMAMLSAISASHLFRQAGRPATK